MELTRSDEILLEIAHISLSDICDIEKMSVHDLMWKAFRLGKEYSDELKWENSD